MARTSPVVGTLLVSTLAIIATSASGAGKKKPVDRADPGLATVEQVLRAEVAGQVDRRKQLAGIVEERSESPAARWQAGYVRDGNVWRSYEEAILDVERWEQYRLRREAASRTFRSQFDLANWCRK